MLFTSSFTFFALLSAASALPMPSGDGLNATDSQTQPQTPPLAPSTNGTVTESYHLTEAQLLQIAPTSKTCTAGGVASDECRTAEQAAPLINAANDQFGVTDRGTVAATVSLMAFESSDFKFQRNQGSNGNPGNPGQGTRNLMNFPFILQYALDTPETKDSALKLVPEETNLSTVSNDTKNALLDLMLPDSLSFASAAWFLVRSKNPDTGKPSCNQTIIDGLKEASVAGWEAYITLCVGTTVTEERRKVYDAALTALPVA